MIRGSTYPIDVISRSPLNWLEKWFDSGTGKLEIRTQGITSVVLDLDLYRLPNFPGRYRIFYTMPDVGAITMQAQGTVDSYAMRTNAITIQLTRG